MYTTREASVRPTMGQPTGVTIFLDQYELLVLLSIAFI